MANTYLNQRSSKSSGRVLWFDPNPIDNVPVNIEDLNISVSLEATSKNKTIITKNGKIVKITNTNNGGKDTTINFIRSSQAQQPGSLTTSYSEIEHIINSQNDYKGNGYESLGIESINIEFNTSYAPMIKIKMIDVRGASLFSNQGKGDYNFFFELPYPLFSLEIKGFYGRPVNYCLHLIRFNASFNSQTGNFEIDCDFIGYTYALLNDMLMGMLRGVQDTAEGNSVFKAIKSEYKPEIQPQIIKINDLIAYIDKGNFNLSNNIEKDAALTKKVEAYYDVLNGLDTINKNIIETINSIKDGYKGNSTNNNLIYEDVYEVVMEEDINNYSFFSGKLDGPGGYTEVSGSNVKTLQGVLTKNNITDITVNDNDFKYNSNLQDPSSQGNTIIKSDIDDNAGTDITKTKIYDTIQKNSLLDYKNTLNIENTASILINNKLSINTDDTKLIIIDFNYAAKNLENYSKTIRTKIDDLENQITNDLNNKIYNQTKKSSNSTIRSLFRVLSIGVDTFLKTLQNISIQATNNNDRDKEFNKILANNDKDLIDSDASSKVSPWPEYRENNGDYYTEKYLGTILNSQKVPELKFTEDLMKQMIEQKIEENENLNSSNIQNQVGDNQNWFPISVLDSDMIYYRNASSGSGGIEFKMITNPYLQYKNEGYQTADDMLTLAILRGFLLLKFANYNKIDDNLIRMHGRLEGWNLKFILDKMVSPKDIALVDGIKKYKTVTEIINKFNGNIFELKDNKLCYKYIIDESTKKAYLPVNGFYNKKWWYKNNKLLPQNELIDFVNNKKILLAGNQKNYSNWFGVAGLPLSNVNVNENNKNNIDNGFDWDGALYVNLIDKSQIEGANKVFDPTRNTILSLAKEKTLINKIDYYNNYTDKTILHKNAEDVLFDNTNTTSYINPLGSYTIDYNVNKFVNTHIIINNEDSNLGKKSYDNTGTSTRVYFFGDSVPKELIPFSETTNGLIKTRTIGVIESQYGYNSNRLLKISNFRDTTGSNIRQNKSNEQANGRVINESFRKNYDDIVFNVKNKDKYYIPKIGFFIINNTEESETFKFKTLDGYITPNKTYYFDLFGSELYYMQQDKFSKALLFLHTFPFQGLPKGVLNGNNSYLDYMILDYNTIQNNETILDKNVNPNVFGIKQLLRTHNALIKIPKIWALFIGGVLWRLEKNTDPIKYPDSYKIYSPRNDEYLYQYQTNQINNFCGIQFINQGFDKDPLKDNQRTEVPNDLYNYSRIDETLRGLPIQVKNEFINYFNTWVSNEWDGLRGKLELKNNGNEINNLTEFKQYINSFNNALQFESNGDLILLDSELKNILDTEIYSNYYSYDLVTDDELKGIKQLNMKLKPNTDIMGKLIDLLIEPVYMQNANPSVWKPRNLNDGANGNKETHNEICIFTSDFTTYMGNFLDSFTALTSNYVSTEKAKVEDAKKSLFGLQDNNLIKLNIYRTLSSIYQKWLVGVDKDNFFAQCSYNEKHDEIAKKERNTFEIPRLLDSFRFVDRAFRDLGDKLYVNPRVFVDVIRSNQNATFFDVANKVLNDNNFVFIPLPTYLNYNDINELRDAFSAYPNNDYNDITSGPSFVCVYVGQVSNNLDLKDGDDNQIGYPDDGIYVTFDEDNIIGLPHDFTTTQGNPYDLNVPIFTVNYGQQNQNYFKDVRLDQKEFTETAESLEIINDLANQGDKTKETYMGQNLFNVYQKRSYSCEVEMLGDALIQPMMYFQLNNIPMFRGLYLIINVKHTIKPNSMLTTFKGVRVKKYKTPLSDINTVLYVDSKSNSSNSSYNSSSYGTVNNSSVYYKGGGDVDVAWNKLKTHIKNEKPFDKDTTIIRGNTVNNNGKITEFVNQAITDWNKGKIKHSSNEPILQKYIDFTGLKTYAASQYSNGSQPWSALFSSYIISNADSEFPKSLAHINYINAALEGKNGYEAFPLKDSLRIEPEIGDLVCQDRQGGTHCDIIYKIDLTAHKAYLIGGNISSTVNDTENNGFPYAITLGDGSSAKGGNYYKDLIQDSGPYYIIIKKTKNAYYKKANITKTVITSSNVGGPNLCEDWNKTIPTTEEIKNNKKVVITILKNNGLNIYQVAGIMGNIKTESSWNHNAGNQFDSCSIPGDYSYPNCKTTDFGLIQYNSSTFNDSNCKLGAANSSKSIGCIRCIVGETAEKQINYLINVNRFYPTWKNTTNGTNSVSEAAYKFAQIVERCASCDGPTKPAVVGRVANANEAYNKELNNPSSEFFWDNF